MTEATGLRQFLILMYKGMLLRKRHYIATFFEIFFPIILATLPVILTAPSSEHKHEEPEEKKQLMTWINSTTFKPRNPYVSDNKPFGNVLFAYAPSNPVTDRFMNDSVARFKEESGFERIIIAPLKSEGELEAHSMKEQKADFHTKIFGTLFNNFHEKLPESLDYKIRSMESDFPNRFPTEKGHRMGNEYTSTNFIVWQTAIEEEFIDRKKKEHNVDFDYEVWIQRFPYPDHIKMTSSLSSITFIPWSLCLGFLLFIVNIVRRVIEEKSNGSKELLKMMGMTDFVYWTSTFTHYFIASFLAVLIITIIFKSPLQSSYVFMKKTDLMLLFLLLLLLTASMILFSMFFSIFFARGVYAVIALLVIYFLSFSMFFTSFVLGTDANYFPLSMMQKVGICLIPTGALTTMFTLISFYENIGVGCQWSNISEYTYLPDMNVLIVMLSMLMSCVLYAILIWYLDKVWPWQPGVPHSIYFPFTRNYWCPQRSVEGDEIDLVNSSESYSSNFFEEEPNSTPGVVIQNLTKVFRTGLQTKLAVNNVSLNIYKGQITALLGHNGAGKTTTINILTGLYPPTKGTASINGLDILTEQERARRGLGVCPQNNVLYDTLTVEEHLRIHAAMKGVPWKDLVPEALNVLDMLSLTNKRHELAKNLSGGMKRKLSLAIAIVGGSKVLFLDEPTSGLDVEARRGVWDALLNIRHDRSIVLTTHYMEEADILGDRIAIMAEGEVQCCGSPMFLKHKFGTGYHLHLVKDHNFKLHTMTTFLRKFTHDIHFESELDREVKFKISSESTEFFGDMFEALEHHKHRLGVVFFGITITTMEDVFLNVANISDMKYKLQAGDEEKKDVNMEDDYRDLSQKKSNPTLGNQFFGLLLKRFHYSKRQWGILVVQLIIPLLLMFLLLHITQKQPNTDEVSKPLKMDLSEVYGSTEGFYYVRNNDSTPITEAFLEVLKSNKVKYEQVDDPTQFVLKYGKDSISDYLKTLMVGGAIDKYSNGTWNLTAWYNGEPFHTLPMSLSMMHTAILKTVAKTGTISLYSELLPNPRADIKKDEGKYFEERIMAGTFSPLAFGFIVGSFTLVPTHERATKAKLLQLMTGLSPALYWATMFIWDFVVYSAICVLMIIPFPIFSHYVFFGPHADAMGTALLIMLLYGWASIPFSYLMSFVFKTGNTGYSVIIGICSMFGIGAGVTLRTLQFRLSHQINVDKYIWICRLIPTFSLSVSFQNLFGLAFANAVCESVSSEKLKVTCNSSYIDKDSALFKCCKELCGNNCLTQIDPLAWDKDSCGPDIAFLFIDGVIHFCLLMLLETSLMATFLRSAKRSLSKKSSQAQPKTEATFADPDVQNEDRRIRNLLSNGNPGAGHEALVVMDLTKLYRNFYAVDHLTLGIRKEECFGLLGVNGAGKTTTFRMITGDCFPTEGNAYIQDYTVTKDLKKFQSFLGYCPQFDAIMDLLTGREMLHLFARLRGLSGQELLVWVDKMIKMTDLTKHADKQTQFYSGGNKRKLSVGLALIGSPPLLLMDEPTAGVDPVSRRKIWNILSQAKHNTGAAIILTTHSMEECEALCGRLGIMVNGKFRCLGSIQELKSKFGQGYTLVIKMTREQQSDPQVLIDIKEHVEEHMPGAQLKDDHQGMLQYHIVDDSVTLGRLFKFMSKMKKQFELEDYLVSDTSLEQIFLTFARAQRFQT